MKYTGIDIRLVTHTMVPNYFKLVLIMNAPAGKPSSLKLGSRDRRVNNPSTLLWLLGVEQCVNERCAPLIPLTSLLGRLSSKINFLDKCDASQSKSVTDHKVHIDTPIIRLRC